MNPWTGCGWNSVPAAYGQAQENYFAAGNYTATENLLAGAPEYVFNEYLQVAIAWGNTCALHRVVDTRWEHVHRS